MQRIIPTCSPSVPTNKTTKMFPGNTRFVRRFVIEPPSAPTQGRMQVLRYPKRYDEVYNFRTKGGPSWESFIGSSSRELGAFLLLQKHFAALSSSFAQREISSWRSLCGSLVSR